MALTREQIEHFQYYFRIRGGKEEKPWKNRSHTRKWFKKQVNKYIRLKGKKISDDEQGGKIGRKPLCGWEY